MQQRALFVRGNQNCRAELKFSRNIKALHYPTRVRARFLSGPALAAANATKQWGDRERRDASGCLASCCQTGKRIYSGVSIWCNLPPESTGTARGEDVDVARGLAAFASRVPHVGLPRAVAGESGMERGPLSDRLS